MNTEPSSQNEDCTATMNVNSKPSSEPSQPGTAKIFVVDDSPELRRQNREVQTSLVRLQELEQLRDNLVQMIVHDVRSSLTTIVVSLDLLEDKVPLVDCPAAGLLRKARDAANRLSRMTAQVLDIGRLESGRMPLYKTDSDLTQTALLAMDSIPASEGVPNCRLDAPESVRLLHDTEVIRRVIENLVCNAIKFSPKGSPVIIAVAREGGAARVSVTDSGPGIPAASHGRIFEKFAQLRPEDNRFGTGLGLAFCKLAVEAHSGQIGVISLVGQGSTFWFTLPIRDQIPL